MLKSKLRARKIGFPLSGALLGLAVEIAIELLKSEDSSHLLDRKTYPHLILGLFIGGILGGLFHITREMGKALDESIVKLEKISTALKYQERALMMLLRSGHYGELLKRLIHDSIESKFTHIAYVNPIEYLEYLIDAIKHSSSYYGIQRKPIYWFKENSAEFYLKTLKTKKMAEKVRIFMIDDADVETMEENLKNGAIMDWYWGNTGQNVQTYWIKCSDFDNHWPSLSIREDFALYDQTLLIKYDETRQVLSFDLIDDTRPEALIFQKLQGQIQNGLAGPFRRIISPS